MGAEKFRLALLICIGLIGMGVLPNGSFASDLTIPEGLSDTAVERQWDHELEFIEPNQVISFNENYDSPTARQLMEYFNNFSSITKADTSSAMDSGLASSKNRTDTTLWKKTNDVPVQLYFIEVYDNSNQLFDYKLEVTSDTTL